MRGVNKVILIGHCGGDPEIKYLPSGSAVATVSLATTESYRDKSGEKKEETQWHKLTFFGPIVDNVVKPYVKKGTSLFVEGKVRYQKYEKDGKTTYFTDILVREVNLLGSGGGGSSGSGSGGGSADGSGYGGGSNGAVDDDIPF